MLRLSRGVTALGLICLCCAAAGCGQKRSTSTGAGVSPAPVLSTNGIPLSSRKQRHGGAAQPMPSTGQAPIPANLDCTNSPPVWVNSRTKVYHLPGDVYYGRTRNGVYMCEKDAAAAGDRPAKAYR